MRRKRHRRDGEHHHDPEQPAELRDVIVVTGVAVVCVVGVSVVLRVIDLGHAFHYTPWGYLPR